MALPTMHEIVNLYLYGQKQKPNDLLDASLTDTTRSGANLDVDVNEYMINGGGRFVNAKDFSYIDTFFNNMVFSDADVPPGSTRAFTKRELLEMLGYVDANGNYLMREVAYVNQALHVMEKTTNMQKEHLFGIQQQAPLLL